MNYTHTANPVRVSATRILEVTDVTRREPGYGQSSPDLVLRLEDGRNFEANSSMTARFVPLVGDYVVTQEDGYTYLNPKDVFERKYSAITEPRETAERAAPVHQLAPGYLTFGLAIQAIKLGERVARAGWNGKGMWLAYSPGSKALPAAAFWSPANGAYAQELGGAAEVLPCITMKTATGEILMGWLASQSDMLAEDWVIVS